MRPDRRATQVLETVAIVTTVAALGLLNACGPAVPLTPGDAGEGSSTSSGAVSEPGDPPPPPLTTSSPDPTSPVTTSPPDPPATSTSTSTTSVSGESSSSDSWETSAGFITDPDGGNGGLECSVFEQDCAPGDKCTPWANDGGTVWNATRCVPVTDEPDGVGDACTVEGSPASGMDSCDATSMCFGVDEETGTGICRPFCEGSEALPICPADFLCPIGGDSVLVICLPTCDPLALHTCGEQEVCVPYGENFVCAPATTDAQTDEPCEFLNACEAGLVCTAAETLKGCDGAVGCCTPFCSIVENDCPASMTCVPYYEGPPVPDGLEDVGVCFY